LVNALAAIESSEQGAKQASGSGTIGRVTQAIKQASARTGVDFSYLMNKASQESGLDPNAKATGSSATGLFQFTSQTWLQTVKNYGSQFGLGSYASQISVDSNGTAHVNNTSARQAILALRKDPTVSAEMAGELDKQNMGTLQTDVGGKIGPTELYLAHFLGAGGASEFLNTMKSQPSASAAHVLPEAAAANPSVFFDKSGAPRSVSQIYKQFAAKFDNPPAAPGGMTMLASAQPSPDISTLAAVSNAANIPASPGNYSLPVMSSGVQPSAPSLQAAMVVAQMDLKSMADNQLSGVSDASNDGRKKNSATAALEIIA
jgi:hypothetical protein